MILLINKVVTLINDKISGLHIFMESRFCCFHLNDSLMFSVIGNNRLNMTAAISKKIEAINETSYAPVKSNKIPGKKEPIADPNWWLKYNQPTTAPTDRFLK